MSMDTPTPQRAPLPPLSEETRAAMRRLRDRYPEPRSALLPMLYLIQSEHGFVSDEGVEAIQDLLELSKAEIAGVSTFYTMFKRVPLGEYLISVCTQPPCALAGATKIKAALEEELGIGFGQTHPDGRVSVEEAECLCACDGAPVVQINYENYEGLTPETALEIVRAIREGRDVPPGRHGVPAAGRAEAHRALSGIDGVRDGSGA